MDKLQQEIYTRFKDIIDEIVDEKSAEYKGLLEDAMQVSEECSEINKAKEAMLDGETECAWCEQVTSWKRVVNAARRTIGKESIDNEPKDSWKAKILLAEHSPIRLLEYDFGWKNIRQWVSVHLVRHHIGFEKFVHSQRSDRRELPVDRDHIYQGAKNDMDATANAQALISISRKRLCNCASPETRKAWTMIIDEVRKIDPVLADKCVPECIYRGFCPEWMSKCGYSKSDTYKIDLAKYRNTKYEKEEWKAYKDDENLLVSNAGRVKEIYNLNKAAVDSHGNPIIITEKLERMLKPFRSGLNQIVIQKTDSHDIYPVSYLVYDTFGTKMTDNVTLEYIENIDGNIFNNDIDNLRYKALPPTIAPINISRICNDTNS